MADRNKHPCEGCKHCFILVNGRYCTHLWHYVQHNKTRPCKADRPG